MTPTSAREGHDRLEPGSPRRPPHVVVVGAGISGLAAAYFLATGKGQPQVTVLEQDARIGGKLEVLDLDGLPIDQGAESVLARRPEALDLARAVGLGDDLVEPGTTSASIWSRGSLRPLPAGTVLGIPTDLRSLATSGLLSRRGLARVPLDLVLPWTRHVAVRDVPVGWYVQERLGREVVDRLVEPLLGGVYAGHPSELSLDATMPALAGPVRRHRSLLAAATETFAATDTSAGGAKSPVFASVRGGLGRLPAAVAQGSGASVLTGRIVRALHRTPTGWRLVAGPTADQQMVEADAVVLACPAAATRRLLSDLLPAAANALAGLGYASVATVTMVFDDPAVRDRLHGSGFLVPAVEGRLVKAVTYLTEKWPWLGAIAGEQVVVRASVGRHGEIEALQRDPEELALAVATDVAAMAGTPARPRSWHVRKWGGGLPQYTVGHLERVADVRRAVAASPGLAVCGAAYDGVGVAACVASARAAADLVLGHLSAATTMDR